MIKTLTSTKPLVLFNGIKILSDTIYNRSKHKIENSSSYSFLEVIKEDFPNLCLSDYYIEYFLSEKCQLTQFASTTIVPFFSLVF